MVILKKDIERLLTPRVQVVNPIPHNNIQVGTILELNVSESLYVINFREGHQLNPFSVEEVKRCKANFQEIHWSFNRSLEEMPKYIRHTENKNIVYKVEKWGLRSPREWVTSFNKLLISSYDTIPISEVEYQEILSSLQAKGANTLIPNQSNIDLQFEVFQGVRAKQHNVPVSTFSEWWANDWKAFITVLNQEGYEITTIKK